VDFVLKASGYSDIYEAIGILWDVIQKIWWGIDGVVCVRSSCLHKNIYPTLMPFPCYQYRGTGIDLGDGRILHQIILVQTGSANKSCRNRTVYCKTSNSNTLFFLY
jgi:hypothetical protein